MAPPEKHLSAVPEPEGGEPIVLTIAGQNVVTWPQEPAYLIAAHAREVEQQRDHLERELRGKRSLVAKLREDQAKREEQKRLSNPEREFIFEVFDTYRTESGRKACKLTPERFDMTAARLAEEYERVHILMAAVGIAVNPYTIEGEKRNDFETAMKDGASVERYANRCPPERRAQIKLQAEGSGKLFA